RVQQDAPHDLSGASKEVGAVLPIDLPKVHQTHIRFMHQGRGLEGLTRLAGAHATACDPAKFQVDPGSQPFEGAGVSLGPGAQKPGCLRGFRLRHGVPYYTSMGYGCDLFLQPDPVLARSLAVYYMRRVQSHESFMPLAAHARLGPYEILAPIGSGGMGEVYRARDTRLRRDVAIKVLPQSGASEPHPLRRLELEARAASQLNHPNIVTVFDIGLSDGAPYIVQELLEGETLRQRMSEPAILLRKSTDYALQIAQALAAAHRRGIVHRDLKPENLFVT